MIPLERAFALAEANLRFEGMRSSPEAKALFNRVQRGEIHFEEARNELLESIGKKAAASCFLSR